LSATAVLLAVTATQTGRNGCSDGWHEAARPHSYSSVTMTQQTISSNGGDDDGAPCHAVWVAAIPSTVTLTLPHHYS